jgi:hypothetical protein
MKPPDETRQAAAATAGAGERTQGSRENNAAVRKWQASRAAPELEERQGVA